MRVMGYTSRNIPSPEIYADTIERRIAAKRAGDTETANALKLVLNTTYGAMLNKYNDLYDPLMGRSVCITGQLFLLELANHLTRDCPSLKVVQLNTDGIMVSFEEDDYEKVLEITQEWQDRTGFELEEDEIKEIVQKDVNNYVEIPFGSGEPKIKGGLLVRGIAPAGAFNINNNAVVVARAIRQFFVDGTPPEETVAASTDILDFQLISKAGGKYSGCYHMVDGQPVKVQKVNRVYAVADRKMGTVYKTHAETGVDAKVSGLPAHCVIDNKNELSIEAVDRKWYIKLAKKYINAFQGVKPPRKNTRRINSLKKKCLAIFESNGGLNMAKNYKEMNVRQKLAEARLQFLNSKVDKSGKNMHLEFKYFELEDIVPVAIRIFADVGLVSSTNFDGENACMTILNTDCLLDPGITFAVPYRENPTIVSNKGKEVTNPMQALGASITYLRRYLWMMALDITEPDDVDANLGADKADDEIPAPNPETAEKEKRKTKTRAPATTAERKAAKKDMTNTDGPADELQITALKNACKKIMGLDETQEEFVQQIAMKTRGFTEITRSACEQLVNHIGEMIAACGEGT